MQTGTFPRQMRLTSPADYQQVFNDPDKCKSVDGVFTILARRNGLTHARLGLAIAAKHLKHAVSRNRVKRQIRESFRLNQLLLAGLDIVVISRVDTGKSDNKNLRKALDKHWAKIIERCENC